MRDMDRGVNWDRGPRYFVGNYEWKQTIDTANCDPPRENREKGECTGTHAMTRHAKRVTIARICAYLIKAGFHMIADHRSQIADRNKSAIVCDHMETHFCDPAIAIADNRRR